MIANFSLLTINNGLQLSIMLGLGYVRTYVNHVRNICYL